MYKLTVEFLFRGQRFAQDDSSKYTYLFLSLHLTLLSDIHYAIMNYHSAELALRCSAQGLFAKLILRHPGTCFSVFRRAACRRLLTSFKIILLSNRFKPARYLNASYVVIKEKTLI